MLRLPRPAARFGRTPLAIPNGGVPPLLGEHGVEVLRDWLGISEQEALTILADSEDEALDQNFAGIRMEDS